MSKSTKYRATHQGCCDELDCVSGLRNNYFEGKRLSVDSFRVEQNYLMERRRLLNRAIHGWGVVYGYQVKAGPAVGETDAGQLMIGPGLALDACGRELLETERAIELSDLIFFDENGVRIDLEKACSKIEPNGRRTPAPEWSWLLSVHYAEQLTAPVTVEDSCRCEHHRWDHTCETVRYSLRRIPWAERCRDFGCELNCDCKSGNCCDHPIPSDTPRKRGGCNCLCDHLTHLVPRADSESLCEIEESCGHVRVDLRKGLGVSLACVDLVRVDRQRCTFGETIESCGPRRLVKRNDLLYDLIRGCDLTRIIDFGWKPWHRHKSLIPHFEPIPFADFSAAFGSEGNHWSEYVTRDFWVEFSRPVRQDTLRPDCFAMTILTEERQDGWWQVFRVPIIRLDFAGYPPKPNDPKDHVRGAKIVVDGDWLEDGLRGNKTLFLGSETRVELEVRGDFIIDCNGQAVDANAVGLSPIPTGNGTPGGTFLSTFRVGPARDRRATPDDRGRRQTGVSA